MGANRIVSEPLRISLPAVLLAAIVVTMSPGRAAGDVIRVPADRPTIQEALDVAADGDTVLVAPGEYAISAPLNFNRLHVPGDDTSPPRKDLELRSETGAEATIIRMSETPDDPDESSVFVFERGESIRSVVEGFTVREGQGRLTRTVGGRGVRTQRAGGGFLIRDRSAVRVSKCLVVENLTRSSGSTFRIGGGFHLENATLELVDTELRGNIADSFVAIYSTNSDVTIDGVRIIANQNQQWGSLVGLYDRVVSISNCLVADNFSRGHGIDMYGEQSISVDRLTLAGNHLFEQPLRMSGGGELTNSIVWGNLWRGSWRLDGLIDVKHSCLEDYELEFAETVIDTDPLFCAWGGDTRYVSAGAPPDGDGSAERPFASIGEALRYDYGLSAASPCMTAGGDGGPIGADVPGCAEKGPDRTTLIAAPGRYAAAVLPLHRNVTLHGAGRDQTTVQGTLVGLRPGSSVRDVTIEVGPAGGIWADEPTLPDASSALENVDVVRCRGTGGLFMRSMRVEIRSCRVLANLTDGFFGAGIYLIATRAEIADCLVAANVSSAGAAGIFVVDNASSVNARGVTIAGNSSIGLRINGGQVSLRDSVVWANSADEEILIHGDGQLLVDFSCLPEPFVDRGQNNISVDPLFCGWARGDFYVDAGAAAGGDGTADRPFRALRLDSAYDWALAPNSPCRATGENGADRGWPGTSCDEPGPSSAALHLASGRYEIVAALPAPLSIAGAGASRTTIAGDLRDVRADAVVRDVTVEGHVYVARGAAPVITACTLRGGFPYALQCGVESEPLIEDSLITEGAFGGAFCEIGSKPSFANVTIRGNNGIGLASRGAEIEIEDSRIERNAGGLNFVDGSADVSRSLLVANDGCAVTTHGTQLWIDRTTIAHNFGVFGCGVWVGGPAQIQSSILWDNSAGGLAGALEENPVEVSFSCVEGEPPAGEGNINLDPRFCGFGESAAVWVDADVEPGGDGTRDRPYQTLDRAVDPSFALSQESPCLGTGRDAGDMGAPFPTCSAPSAPNRTIHLAPGTYVGTFLLGPGVSLAGSGPSSSTISGRLVDVRGNVSDLRVEGSDGIGIFVSADSASNVERVVVVRHASSGIVCGPKSEVRIADAIIDENEQNGVTCWEDAKVVIERSVLSRSRGFVGGHGRRFGGGFYSAGSVKAELTACRIERNFVNGIFSSQGDDLKIVGSRIVANGLSGIQSYNSSFTIWDSIIAGNHGYSGSALVGGELRVDLVGCTITENNGDQAGDDTSAVHVWQSELTVRNSVVSGNGVGKGIVHERNEEQPVGFTRVSHSIVEGVLPGHAEITEVLDADPMFRRPGEGEGVVWVAGDYRLRAGSPAIDSGSEPVPTTIDLDGRPRILGPAVDMGALEFVSSKFRRGDANIDGDSNIADPIFVLGFLFADETTLDCAASADTNADDALNIADPIYHLNYLFGDGMPPPPPFDECDAVLPDAELACGIFPGCEG